MINLSQHKVDLFLTNFLGQLKAKLILIVLNSGEKEVICIKIVGYTAQGPDIDPLAKFVTSELLRRSILLCSQCLINLDPISVVPKLVAVTKIYYLQCSIKISHYIFRLYIEMNEVQAMKIPQAFKNFDNCQFQRF